MSLTTDAIATATDNAQQRRKSEDENKANGHFFIVHASIYRYCRRRTR